MSDSSQQVQELCIAQGFALAGIASAAPSSYSKEFSDWLAEGKQGEMAWMQNNKEVRVDPNKLLEGAKSVICVADRYTSLQNETLPEGHGKIARYARGRDYHKVMKKRLHAVCDELKQLHPDVEFRACVDTAPIFEREFASRAGLGSIGKHTLLLEQSVGSWLLLGVIVTTGEFVQENATTIDPCMSCTRCVDACPTDALTPWELDARKCISYLTIEHRSQIDEEYYEGIGEWLFGCDVCQEVCPHNQSTLKGQLAPINDVYEPKFLSLSIQEVLKWDEDTRRDVFQGLSMKRATLQMMRRNAVIVAGNIIHECGDPNLHALLQTMSESDADVFVAQTAKQVLHRLQSRKD